MLNFSLGPVQMDDELRCMGANEIPYFRTDDFSKVVKENEELIVDLMDASDGSRAVFLTGSGTAAMEATVMNLFTENDKLLVIDGGSFGDRFVKICEVHKIPHSAIKLELGTQLRESDLAPFDGRGYTGLLVNVDETSSGVLYDMGLISAFCRENGMLLVVDAISSFLCDPYSMKRWGVDATLISTQKALALPPGMSIVVLGPRALERVEDNDVQSLYFDFKDYLKDGERGQTPYTPAVGILLQMNRRFKQISEDGIDSAVNHSRALAEDFRRRIVELPFEILFESHSNAHTPVHPTGVTSDGKSVDAYHIFELLKDEYGIYVCPVGGEWSSRMFRVGHLGALTINDNTTLLNALNDLHQRGEL